MNTYHITPHNSSGSAVTVSRGIIAAIVGLALGAGTLNLAHAGTLSSGTLTLVPMVTGAAPTQVYPAYGTSTGTWSSPAASAWLGSFSFSGPLPTSGGSIGTTTYDFSTLPDGYLPTGSYFDFSDLDHGSGTNESYTLYAYDTSGNPLALPWLNTVAQSGTGSGTGGSIQTTDMPSYQWTTNSTYYFTGAAVPGNPAIEVNLSNNQNIGSLVVTRDSNFNSLSIGAPVVPVPEPSCVALFAGSFGVLFLLLRRRTGTTV